ncbi:dienelactone hydrolase family protein [Haliangium sp.]|uniref:dienelactone hydrolase family protein n=1 Tax=Haliangium sp. TaxID=2663208 RepID=UPI003D0FEC2B
MPVTTRTETITAPDGGHFDAHVALPAAGTGPGVLVIQEIFGVNHYIRDRCAKLAALGYVAMAPDCFWRLERNLEIDPTTPEAVTRAQGYVGRFDGPQGTRDLIAALAHLRALPEAPSGKAGVLGFCFGGTMAYVLACNADPDVAVCYYGSRIDSMLDQGDNITCPTLFQYGGKDAYISADQVAQVAAFAADKDHIEHRVYDAGHAFDNEFSPLFSDPAAQVEAWEVTRAFLATHLPA